MESEAYKAFYEKKREVAELALAASLSDRADQLMPEELVVYKGLLAQLAKRYVSETTRGS